MAGIPKAGRPQEPTGTSRGGIACSTATMQDPWQWFPASDTVTGSKHHAGSTSASDPPQFSRLQGVTAGTSATLLHLVDGWHAEAVSSQGSDRQGQLVECDRHPPGHRFLDRELVVAAPKVLHQAMPGLHDRGTASWLRPRIGRRRACSRPWSHSMRLLASWSVRCHVAGSRSSSTAGYAAAGRW